MTTTTPNPEMPDPPPPTPNENPAADPPTEHHSGTITLNGEGNA